MDPGTALALLALIKPIAKTIVEAWQDAKYFGGDSRGFDVRFNLSKTSLDHYESILFDKDKLPGIVGRLYDNLSENERQTIFDMLGELYLVLKTYMIARRRYELDNHTDRNSIGLKQNKEERDALLVSTAESKDAQQAHAVSWVRKTWWTVWDKKSVEKVVRDFEKWIKRLGNFMKLIWGPLPFLTSLPRLQQLEKDNDAQQVGLLEDVPLRKLIVAPNDAQINRVKSLETTASSFSASQPQYGIFKEQKVFVEYKSYDVNKIGIINDVASDRIDRLIALLHETKDDRFKVLRCTNYFEETSERRIALVFRLPPGLDGPPSSLLAALSCSSSSRPSLTARMRLAHSLSETLILLHSVNWLHKSIRSETALLLHAGDTLPPREAIPDLGNPRLCGFEYSRPDNDFTSGHPDFEIRRNIYRHPDRWGQPKESFSKIHDIYCKSAF